MLALFEFLIFIVGGAVIVFIANVVAYAIITFIVVVFSFFGMLLKILTGDINV